MNEAERGALLRRYYDRRADGLEGVKLSWRCMRELAALLDLPIPNERPHSASTNGSLMKWLQGHAQTVGIKIQNYPEGPRLVQLAAQPSQDSSATGQGRLLARLELKLSEVDLPLDDAGLAALAEAMRLDPAELREFLTLPAAIAILQEYTDMQGGEPHAQ